MGVLRFKCVLLSDVILNQKAATEGPNTTLDFIPGNCFLGIAASNIYTEKGMCKETLELFHSKQVRFGDAHPALNDNSRGLKVPAVMYHPKLEKESEACYIYPKTNLENESIKEKQLKQCRNGFYDFSSTDAKRVVADISFAIKSAYDKEERRSKDAKMYGYESLQKGLNLLFEVEVDNENYIEPLKEALIGKKRVGRSKTAQYGLVEITEMKNDFNIKSNPKIGKEVYVYADGRLIFLDEDGQPTFRPTEEQLGIKNGKILWEKSQIRTFQYSPWNYARQCFDTDRCGIEKGSVFVIETDEDPNESKYVGSYNNEGFGKIIYNPSFLDAESDGKAKYKLHFDDVVSDGKSLQMEGTPLLAYIFVKQKEKEEENFIYESVNKWVEDNGTLFKKDTFAAQWGTIRTIATKHPTKESLLNELFDKKHENNGKEEPAGYLTHGIAAEKWEQGKRREVLRNFIERQKETTVQRALINLAAEMAKEVKRNKEGEK